MKYLHVANKAYKHSLEFDQAILRQSGHCLYSLIEGLRDKDFGLHTLSKVLKNIQDYKNKCVTPVSGRLFTDSGGYSIIVGDVHPMEIPRFIQCYDHYLVHQRAVYEYIFSLDIPLSLKHDNLNTKTLIYEYNKQSLLDAKRIMEAHPEIRDKYYFVWQFKLLEQYAIWCRLYDELGFGKLVGNHALGGMVGVRGVTNINYSPFIPMAFKCLHEWLAGGLGGEFRLHFLGMYIPYDRFQIALLEQLFRRYLDQGQTVAMSYDSINPAHAMRLNKDLPFFSWGQGGLDVYARPADVPQAVLASVYDTQSLRDAFDEGVWARANGKRLRSTNTFVPLNIYSNNCLDEFFEYVVSSTGLVDMFIGETNHTRFLCRTNILLKILARAHPEVFTPRMVRSVRENLDITFRMHFWFENDGRPAELERLIVEAIQNLNFPFQLK